METFSSAQEEVRLDDLVEAHILNYLIVEGGSCDASSLFEGVAKALKVDGEFVAASMWDLQAEGLIQYQVTGKILLIGHPLGSK